MSSKTEVKFKDGMHFEADLQGFKINIDAGDKFGGQGKGPTPKPLLLVALGGCTGMDVVSMLKKMRVSFSEFSVDVSGEMSDEHPKVYTSITVSYKIKGDNIPYSKIKKAVDLSKDRYCGVNAMLKASCEIKHEIVGEGINYDS